MVTVTNDTMTPNRNVAMRFGCDIDADLLSYWVFIEVLDAFAHRNVCTNYDIVHHFVFNQVASDLTPHQVANISRHKEKSKRRLSCIALANYRQVFSQVKKLPVSVQRKVNTLLLFNDVTLSRNTRA
jgi:hypothetical protein